MSKDKNRSHQGRVVQGLGCKLKSRRVLVITLGLVLIGCLCPVVVFAYHDAPVATMAPAAASAPAKPTLQKCRSLDELLTKTPEQLKDIDIAEMNLLCASGLPGSEDMDIDKCLATLDKWAAHVKIETERHLYRLTDPRYKDHAEHYKHSEARFRAEWLVMVLQQDFGVHYHAGFVPQDQEVPPFKTSKETFLNGLLDNEDGRKAFGGNCVSLPVLYAAVGRRLGYPIKLVTSKEHTFCRWEGLDSPNPAWRERFNFDGAGDGFSIDPDEFYLTWPRPSTLEQARLAGWLKSLTPSQEFAVFLLSRGHVLVCVKKDFANAELAYAQAVRLWPTSIEPRRCFRTAMAHLRGAALPEAYASSPIYASADKARDQSRFWWQTPEGREIDLARVQGINEQNRQSAQQSMQTKPLQFQPYAAPTLEQQRQ